MEMVKTEMTCHPENDCCHSMLAAETMHQVVTCRAALRESVTSKLMHQWSILPPFEFYSFALNPASKGLLTEIATAAGRKPF